VQVSGCGKHNEIRRPLQSFFKACKLQCAAMLKDGSTTLDIDLGKREVLDTKRPQVL
jgi:hypothetical protein